MFLLVRHYHRICHQLKIYGMNPVDVFATVKIHCKHNRSCVNTTGAVEQHSTSLYSTIDWLYALEMLQEVVTHVTELLKSPYCMTNYVCP